MKARNKFLKTMAVILTVAVFALTGCSSTKLAEAFDEETVKSTAKEAVDALVAGEYEKVVGMMTPSMQEALTSENLAANMDIMNGQTGAFKAYKSTAVVGQKDAQGTDMAVVVFVVEFEKKNVTYTISFYADMKIGGLRMK